MSDETGESGVSKRPENRRNKDNYFFLPIPPTIVVKIEQNCQEKSKGNRKKDIANADVPKVHQPGAVGCRLERLARGEGCNGDITHSPYVDKPGEEDNGQGRSVVFEKLADVAVEELAFAQLAADPPAHEDEQGDHDAQIGGGSVFRAPLSREDLDAFLEVNESNVETENITRKTSHISQSVACIGDREDPVHNQRPTLKMVTELKG